MPEVRAGETEDQYLKRCIPEVIDEGASPDQAVAICIAKYNKERDTYEGQFKKEHVLYHKSFHNIRESFTKKYTRRTIRALKDMLTPIFDANTVDEMRGVNLNQKPLDDLFLDLYTDVGSTFAKLSYNNLKQHMTLETKQAPDFVERMATFASTGHDRTRVIAINQGKEIQRLIGKALEEELGIVQAGERVKELVTQNINTYQAERIARTEILSASNFGSVEGAKSTGLPLMKQWISVLGDSTRNGHSSAHGTVVDLYDENGGDGVFEVGGEFLRFAGDPNGRPDNIINCRCTQVFLTKEEALGEQAEQEEEEVPLGQQRYEMMAGEVKSRRDWFKYMRTRGIDPKNTPRNILNDGYEEMAKQYEYLLDTFGEDPITLQGLGGTMAFDKKGEANLIIFRNSKGKYELTGNINIQAERGRDRITNATYWQGASEPNQWNRGTSYMNTFLHEMIHHYDFTYGVKKYNKGRLTFTSDSKADKFWDTKRQHHAMSTEIYQELLEKYGKEATLENTKNLLGDYAYNKLVQYDDPVEIVTLAFQKYYNNRNDEFTDFIVTRFIQKYKQI
jgi:hypothetical protein